MAIKATFWRSEVFWFWVCCILFAWPAWIPQSFSTLDGPAHLYNSNLLAHWNSSENIKQFFHLNTWNIPNWIGHLVLIIGIKLKGWLLAEKLVLGLYLILFPLGIRQLLAQLVPSNKYLVYLFFPLMYSHFFYLGFYNYNLSLAFFPWALVIYIHLKRHETIWKWVMLSAMLVLIYYCHIVLAAFAAGVIGLMEIRALVLVYKNERQLKLNFLFGVLIACIPILLLSIQYFLVSPTSDGKIYLTVSEKLLDLKDWSSFYMFNDLDSEVSLVPIKILMLLGIIFLILRRKTTSISAGPWSTYFWIIPVLALLAYLILPDMASGAGYISKRFLGLFVLTFLIWLSTYSWPKAMKWIVPLTVISTLYTSNKLFHMHRKIYPLAAQLIQVGEHLPAGSVVYPVTNSDNWFLAHFSNYAGFHAPIILLENYEASTGYFPLTWKNELSNIRADFENSTKSNIISHILILGNLDKAYSIKHIPNIERSLQLVKRTKDLALYKVRK